MYIAGVSRGGEGLTEFGGADVSQAFLDVVEQAAIACARTMGQGDRHHSDHVAVEAMRSSLDHVPIESNRRMDGRGIVRRRHWLQGMW